MNLWGVVDVLKQRNLLREKWDLIKEGYFVPLHPRELSRLYHSQEREVRSKNVISKPSDSVALSEVTVVVKRTHLTWLSSELQQVMYTCKRNSFSLILAVCDDNCTNPAEPGVILGNLESIGGYVCYRKSQKQDFDSWRYVCLKEVIFDLNEHELRSICLFLQYIIDSMPACDFSSGSCIFEYPYWAEALKECCNPRLNVIVV